MRKPKNFIFLIFIFVSLGIFSQVPQSFKYQAMARKANGDVIVNQTVSLLVEILQGANSVYSETHNVVTNQFGLINLEIGNGSVITGTFASIDWSLGDYYIAVSLDPNGGTNYSSVGTAQLLSVPYALYANKSGDSYWQKDQSNLNYSQGNVGIGTSSLLPGSKLTINNTYAAINEGIFCVNANQTTDNEYLKCTLNSRMNSSSVWTSQAQAAGISANLILDRDNANSYDSYSTGASFNLNLNAYSGLGDHLHYLSGSYSQIQGTVSSYPKNNVISAVIAVDEVNSPQTYAGYFLGRGYFSGNVGIGTTKIGGVFNPKLLIRDGYVQISDSSDTKDAALVINHLRRTGYGFSRTLQIVHEGVIGDPYSEYRIRNTNDDATVTSWSLGIDNSDDDKFVLVNALNVPTGSSPSTGNRILSITRSGNFGIGSTNPDKKLVIEDNIDGINEGNRRIFVELNNKSVDAASEVEMNLKAGANGTITKILKYSNTYNAYPGQEIANYGMLSDDGGGIIIRAWDNSGKIIFKTAHDGTFGHGIERMRIDSQGRVGIGVEQPERTLQIKDVMRIEPSTAPANPKEGDIYMDAATHKLMVYDGTTWQACW